MDKRLYNISLLGLSFTFLFAAYQSMGNIEVNTLQTFFSGWEYILKNNFFLLKLQCMLDGCH